MLACTHLFLFFFSPSLSFLPEALSGRLLVDPLGFLLAFEIISLFPAVAGLGTGAERQRERKSPESRWGCSLNSSTILTVSNCLIFTLVNLSARPYSERITHTPLPSEGLLQALAKIDNNYDITTSFTDSTLCIKAMQTFTNQLFKWTWQSIAWWSHMLWGQQLNIALEKLQFVLIFDSM